jgi:hypothetical protein
VSGSASGDSCGVVAEQVPGGVVTVAAAAPAPAAPAAPPPVATDGEGPTIGLSGMTAATPGLSEIRAAAVAGIRAEIAVTSW